MLYGLHPIGVRCGPVVMALGTDFRPPSPPAVGSAEYEAALAVMLKLSDTSTPKNCRSSCLGLMVPALLPLLGIGIKLPLI